MQRSCALAVLAASLKLAASAGAQLVDIAAHFTAHFPCKRNAVYGLLLGAFHAHMVRADSGGKLGRYCTVFMGTGFSPIKRDTKRSTAGSALYTFLRHKALNNLKIAAQTRIEHMCHFTQYQLCEPRIPAVNRILGVTE